MSWTTCAKREKDLEGASLSYTEADVLHVELPHMPERLAILPESWLQGDQHNVPPRDNREGCEESKRVFAVSDLDKAARVR